MRGLFEDNDGVAVTSRLLLTPTNEVTRRPECHASLALRSGQEVPERAGQSKKKGGGGRGAVESIGSSGEFKGLVLLELKESDPVQRSKRKYIYKTNKICVLLYSLSYQNATIKNYYLNI